MIGAFRCVAILCSRSKVKCEEKSVNVLEFKSVRVKARREAPPHPRAIWIVVKIKGLWEKGFVRL